MKLTMLVLVFFVCASLYSQTAVAPSGLGTQASPYLISSWQNLYWISQNSGEWDKHYEQTGDLDFAAASPAINTWDGGAGWTPIGNSSTKFTGSYDGQEYTISNLYINRPDEEWVGFFGSILSSASLTDVILSDVGVEGY